MPKPTEQIGYQPPTGKYDQPFYYIFDGSPLTDGVNALNQAVQLDPGIGDFIMRRAVGWSNVVNIGDNGAYQLKDYSKNPLSAAPLFVNIHGLPFDDGVYPREQFYPATGKIGFDLYSVLRATPLSTAQIAFMGIRRQAGVIPLLHPPYRFRPQTQSYIQTVLITTGPGVNQGGTLLSLNVNDYDFELLELRISYLSIAIYDPRDLPAGGLKLQAVIPGPAGAFSVTVIGGGPINQAFQLALVGHAITITVATDGTGTQTTTNADVVAALAANPFTAALVIPIPGYTPSQLFYTAGGVTIDANASVLSNQQTQFLLFDCYRFQTSNIPMNDVFLNRLGPYQNGAIVPSLLYPVSTQIRMLFFSENDNVPFQVFVEFVGRNRIPC